jgi:hypothetical protein
LVLTWRSGPRHLLVWTMSVVMARYGGCGRSTQETLIWYEQKHSEMSQRRRRSSKVLWPSYGTSTSIRTSTSQPDSTNLQHATCAFAALKRRCMRTHSLLVPIPRQSLAVESSPWSPAHGRDCLISPASHRTHRSSPPRSPPPSPRGSASSPPPPGRAPDGDVQ